MSESKESNLEGLHFDILMEYINTGKTEGIQDPEMIIYLEQLELVRRWYDSLQHESKIIRALCLAYSDLTPRSAKTRYNDSMNYFYSDTTIKKSAYRNKAADKMEKLANAVILSAKEPKDYKYAAEILHKAEIVRGSMEADKDVIPDDIFHQKQPIFIMDPSMIGLPRADRNVLAKQIETFALTEGQKDKLKQEAGVADFQILEHLEQEN